MWSKPRWAIEELHSFAHRRHSSFSWAHIAVVGFKRTTLCDSGHGRMVKKLSLTSTVCPRYSLAEKFDLAKILLFLLLVGVTPSELDHGRWYATTYASEMWPYGQKTRPNSKSLSLQPVYRTICDWHRWWKDWFEESPDQRVQCRLFFSADSGRQDPLGFLTHRLI